MLEKLSVNDLDGVNDIVLTTTGTQFMVLSSRFGNSITTLELAMPEDFTLSQNYPNPFNPKTAISYQLPVSSNVQLVVYNLQGQLVETLVSGEQSAGYYSVNWNGSGFASGVYFYRLSTPEFTSVKKMILLR